MWAKVTKLRKAWGAGPACGQTVRAWAGDDEPAAAEATPSTVADAEAAAAGGALSSGDGRIGGSGQPLELLFGGGLLMTTFREELPVASKARLLWLLAGVIGMSALLLGAVTISSTG